MNYKIVHIIAFLNSLTIRKSINIFKIYSSYYLSRITGKTSHSGFPFSMAIEPTNQCNLKCPQCPSGMDLLTREKGKINMEVYNRMVEELYPYLINITLYFQGEPFLNTDLVKMIKSANDCKILTTISTNGHFLNEKNCRDIVESGLTKIIISLDGLDQETYGKYRVGGNYQRVVNGIQTLVKMRKELKRDNPLIEVQFLVFRHNEHQIRDFKKFSGFYGADCATIKTAQIYNPDSNTEMIPTIEKYSRYKKNNQGKYQIKSSLKNHCFRMWSSVVVLHDGSISPCCFDKEAEHVLGNTSESDFMSIWKSEKYMAFRSRIFSERRNIEMCCNCTEGLKLN